jgi:hypothetical protein
LPRGPFLFPNNFVIERPHEWHPLLQIRPVPTIAGSGKNFINSLGMRGPERTASDLNDKTVVALFGGSTTFDFASPDGESWPDRLGQILGDKYAVINHGVFGYTTAEHVIQTAFFQDAYGVRPTCAVYYVGWNDISLTHVNELDGAYTPHMRNQLDAFNGRRLSHPLYCGVASPAFHVSDGRTGVRLGSVYAGVWNGECRTRSQARGDFPAQRRVHLGNEPPAEDPDDLGRAGDEY